MKSLLLTLFVSYGINLMAQTTNCSGATQVCNDVAFSGNSSGAGTSELNASNQGCLGVEHQSSWYYFQPVTSGTVALTITTSVDYDFAIWATGNCSSLGAPVRCSFSAIAGNTGMASMNAGTSTGCGFFGLFPCPPSATTDVSEGSGGDAWIMPLNVVAGQTYIMLIDNFSASGTPFTLDWTFSGGATLNCTPIILPVELSGLMGYYNSARKINQLTWITESEIDNDYFTIEHSLDGENWKFLTKQYGQGTTNNKTEYYFEHDSFDAGFTNYYRLSQTDKDGATKELKTITIDNNQNGSKIVRIINTMGQEVPADTKGHVYILYEDGTTKCVYR